jgi:hypothetical protein
MRNISDGAVLQDLVSRFRRLAPAQRCLWGTMNAQQMALHVGDASAAVLRQREFSAKPRSGPSTLRRVALLYVLPRMPRGIKSGADPAAAEVDPGQFVTDVERAADLLQRLATAPPDALVDRHPILGPMTRAQWMRWAFMHTDHHLRQFGL